MIAKLIVILACGITIGIIFGLNFSSWSFEQKDSTTATAPEGRFTIVSTQQLGKERVVEVLKDTSTGTCVATVWRIQNTYHVTANGNWPVPCQ